MSGAETFVDSNIVLYLLSADTAKADRAEAVVAGGALVSVQVLNEVASVARRKLGMSWEETNEILSAVRSACPVVALTIETHDCGRRVAQRYGFSVYDAMIVASALQAGCMILCSEDMQDGLVVDGQLRICNPFTAPSAADVP
jgi:predicted nucleic acid-binding protein